MDAKLQSQVLIESLPYLRKFHGETVVIKYGGSAMVDEQLRADVLDDDGLTGDVLDPGKGLDEHFRGLVRYAFRARVLCVLHER